jgi:hypothetical protein
MEPARHRTLACVPRRAATLCSLGAGPSGNSAPAGGRQDLRAADAIERRRPPVIVNVAESMREARHSSVPVNRLGCNMGRYGPAVLERRKRPRPAATACERVSGPTFRHPVACRRPYVRPENGTSQVGPRDPALRPAHYRLRFPPPRLSIKSGGRRAPSRRHRPGTAPAHVRQQHHTHGGAKSNASDENPPGASAKAAFR